MRNLSTLLLALMVSAGVKAQVKKDVWVKNGGFFTSFKSDTDYVFYQLKGRDSISSNIQSENTKGIYWLDWDGVRHSVKDVKRQFMMTEYWVFRKTVISVRGKFIRETKPKWESNMSSFHAYHGLYTINGKQVHPRYIIDKYGKHEVN